MKRLLFIGEVLIILVILLGCKTQEKVDKILVKTNLVMDQIPYIEIEVDIYNKVVSNDEDLHALVNIIKNIQILDKELKETKKTEEVESHELFRVKIYDKLENIIETISISKDIAFYDNKWNFIDAKTYDQVKSFYENLDYEETKDPILSDIMQRGLVRKDIGINDAIQGKWLSQKDSEMEFDKFNFYQDKKDENVFNYVIQNAHEKDFDISIYGREGIFVKGKELAKLNIRMDDTKTYMTVKKTMAGGIIYYDNYVYVDIDTLPLGLFDSYFFYLNSFE